MAKDEKKTLQDIPKKEVKAEEQPKVANAQEAKAVPPHAFYRG